jgi:hypothetical protein
MISKKGLTSREDINRLTRACLTAYEGSHIISEAMTTIAR